MRTNLRPIPRPYQPCIARIGAGILSKRLRSPDKTNYEKHYAPLLINITGSAFSASALTIAVIICDGSDIAAPAFNREQHLCQQRHMEDQSRYERLEPCRELDSAN